MHSSDHSKTAAPGQKNDHPQGKKKSAPKTPRKITGQYLHNAGLYYLQRFASSQNNFKTVMMRKIDRSCAFHQDPDRETYVKMLDQLIETFCRAGLLDDAAYARGMVQSLRRRGTSRKMIFAKLTQKGLSAEQISQSLKLYEEENAASGTEPELAAALRHASRKRLGAFSNKDRTAIDNEESRRLYNKELATFARAGFSYEIAGKVLSMTAQDIEQL